MEVLVSVIGQKLRISTNCKTFVEGTRNFIKFVFSLPDDWRGLNLYAQFVQGELAINRELDSNNSVYLPDEIHDGKCEMLLYGEGGITVAVSDSTELNIKRSHHTTGGGTVSGDTYVFATLEEMREYLQI